MPQILCPQTVPEVYLTPSTCVAYSHFPFSYVRVKAPSRHVDRDPGTTEPGPLSQAPIYLLCLSSSQLWKLVLFLLVTTFYLILILLHLNNYI